jgi:hypothetical protein
MMMIRDGNGSASLDQPIEAETSREAAKDAQNQAFLFATSATFWGQ